MQIQKKPTPENKERTSAMASSVASQSLLQEEGFWYAQAEMEIIQSLQTDFQAREDDIILASSIKTGTTWMKALIFSIVHHESSCSKITGNSNDDPLRKFNPHCLVPTMEQHDLGSADNPSLVSSYLSSLPSPRLLHTHMPYTALPLSIKAKCPIVYIARNPKDTFVSLWHFYSKIEGGLVNNNGDSMKDLFESFCSGNFHYGPFFDHVLSYWVESVKKDSNVLFLMYEDLQRNCDACVRKVARFLGYSDAVKDEEAVNAIVEKCSFGSLANMDVNKSGEIRIPAANIRNSYFFRKGAVGDWKNHLSDEMSKRLDLIAERKLKGLGLQFEYELDLVSSSF